MEISRLLSHWRADPNIGGNIVSWQTRPGQAADLTNLPPDLHPALRAALQELGLRGLYRHQQLAWDHCAAGEHIAIATSTASGKTLAYNLPVLNGLIGAPQARALYLFPTKALTQDQVSGLRRLTTCIAAHQPEIEIPAGVYDGDTPSAHRQEMRTRAQIILTNPDMLHTGILPHHTRWATFFQGLRYIVIDEMHTYRGVFGSHVANILRRLKRVAQFYGAEPQFLLTSATIGNPQELAEQLIEHPVTLIDRDGAPKGERHFLMYNPPLINAELGIRASLLQESVRLAEDLFSYGAQSIIFGRTRRSVEIMLRYLMGGIAPARQNSPTIRAYRSGYLPGRRREIERGLRDGSIRTVVATSALELGIDIGGLGAALLAGYPGNIASTWQRVGRAGRGTETSLAILVTSASPLDQFMARHPEYFFGQSPEMALINPDNPLILFKHLQCASFELPFREAEPFGQLDPAQLAEYLDLFVEAGILHHSAHKYFWMNEAYPAAEISLRSASAQRILIQDHAAQHATTIGEVDQESACWLVHPEAIYLHEAETYRVTALDLEAGIAQVKAVETDYYTRPRQEVNVQLIELAEQTAVQGCTKAHGEINVTTQVIGYQKVRWETHENLGFGDLDLPPTHLQTSAYWLSLDEATIETLRAEGLWANDPNQYGAEWKLRRNQARARDGYRCQACGVPEPENQQHHVHHKRPFRAFADLAEANQLTNLATLCPTCHRRAESMVRIRSGLAGLAYIFSQLTPLYLMCDSGDLGMHTDPKSPLGEGRPTIILFELTPAGVGFSQKIYERHIQIVRDATELIENCPCLNGCPSCVGPGGEEGSGGKQETLALLQKLLTSAQ